METVLFIGLVWQEAVGKRDEWCEWRQYAGFFVWMETVCIFISLLWQETVHRISVEGGSIQDWVA